MYINKRPKSQNIFKNISRLGTFIFHSIFSFISSFSSSDKES